MERLKRQGGRFGVLSYLPLESWIAGSTHEIRGKFILRPPLLNILSNAIPFLPAFCMGAMRNHSRLVTEFHFLSATWALLYRNSLSPAASRYFLEGIPLIKDSAAAAYIIINPRSPPWRRRGYSKASQLGAFRSGMSYLHISPLGRTPYRPCDIDNRYHRRPRALLSCSTMSSR